MNKNNPKMKGKQSNEERSEVYDSSTEKRPDKHGGDFVVLRWIVAMLLAIIIVVLISSLFVHPKMKKIECVDKDKYSEAITLLDNHIKGGLTDELFTPFTPSVLFESQYLYVDLKSNAIFFVDGKNVDSIFYSRLKNNNDNIKLSDVSKDNFNKLIEKFKIEKDYPIDSICKRIKADSTFLSKINKTGTKEDQILSLLYNTLVGDRKGHLIVSIENGDLEIKRTEGLGLCILDVKKMFSLAQDIETNPTKYKGKTLDQLFEDDGVYECTTIMPTAYLDFRGDCIRVAGHKEITGDKYAAMRDTMINNPTRFFIFQNDSLYTIDEVADIGYGYIDRDVLQSAEIVSRGDFSWIIPILLLVLGMIEGMLLFSFFHQKTNLEPDVKKTDEVTKEINNIISKKDAMKVEDLQKLETIINELIKESSDNQETRKERDYYLNKYKQIESVLSGELSIIKILRVILEQWGNTQDLETRINESLLSLRDDYINQYKRQEPFKTINFESEKYRDLLGCRKESALVEKLNEMRVESGNKMAKISTFALIKDTNPTINDIVQIYDEQTGSNLSKECKELQVKANWYDEHYNGVVKPVENLYKNVSFNVDRKVFVQGIFNDLLIPLFGRDNRAAIDKILQSYLTVEDEAKVYGLLMNSRGDFSYSELKKQLTGVIKTEDAVWLSNLREAARRFASINKFNDTMWETFVKDFVSKEKNVVEDKDKAWFFGRIVEIAYHTADYIRSIKDEGNSVYCHNVKLMASNFDMTNGVKEFSPNNPMKSTEHSKKIFQWVEELGVKKMKVVIDNYAIMP